MTEIWRDIRGYKGIYQVSNLGRVRSVEHDITDSVGHTYTIKSRIKAITPNRKRYLKVELWHKNVGRTAEVHRLVADAFIGRCPTGKEVRHLDGNRQNNRSTNLKYGSPKQNQADRFKHGTASVGEKSPTCTITDATARQIKQRYSQGGATMRQVADHFRVSVGSVFRFVNGRRRTTDGGFV